MKNIYYRLLLLPLLLVAWGTRAQAPAWVGATGVPANVPGQQVLAVATNTAGDVFVTGSYTGSVAFGGTTLNSKTGGANGNNQDAYVAKWSTANSSWSWAVSIGGDDTDTGYGIAVNGNNVYVTGQYTGNSAAFNGVALTSVANGEVFVGKLIDGGTTVTNGGAVSAGGASTDRGNAIAVSGSNVYVTGFVNGAATISGTASTGAGSQDIFVAKYIDSGSALTNGGALRAGSTSAERGNAIAVNGTNIYVGAYFNGATATFGNNSAPPFGSTTLTNAVSGGGSSDVVVIKYTDTGSLAFNSVVQAGGSDNERVNGIAVSGSNVYVTGFFASPSLAIAGTTLNNTAGASGTQDVFVAKYVDGGTLTAGGAKSAGGNGGGDDAGNAIAVSGSTVYATGSYTGAISFDGGTTTVPLSGYGDVFVVKYTDASGLTLNGAIGGGSASANGNPEAGTGIAVNGSQAVVGGYVDVLPATFGSYQVTTGGGGFFARVGLAPIAVTSIVPAAANPTNAASVTFTVTFAASVTGLTTSNFATAPSAGITGSSVTSVSGSGTTYTVTVNTGSGSGTLGLTLANDTGLTPGISNEPFTGTPLYTIDKTAPTVTLTSSTATSGGTTSTSPFLYTATFSENVTGFVAGDITVTNGTVTSGPTGSGASYTFQVTPTTAGTVTNVTVAGNSVQDAVGNGNTASNTYAITFTPPTITVAPATLPNGTVAAAYSQTITASGGTAPYTYAITAGALPAGLSLTSAGVLSGTPTAGGSFTFTVRATDASATPGPYTGSRSYTLTIGAPTITVAPAALPNGTQGTAYSQTITASGGTAPYNFAITSGALPAGLSLNLSNGTISGTPTVNGTFNFTVTATDASTASGPYSGSRSYSLVIAPPPSVTVVSVTRLTPSPTATAQVSYRVVFSGSVTGLTVSNFTTANGGTTVSGSSISSTSGSGTTYTVVVNTGTGDGTLRLDVANSTGITPTVSNVPYTAGEVYTITKSFAAAPTLRIQAAGSASGNSDVTAFVDVVQVLSGGTAFANGLQNGSFESNNVNPSSFLYQQTGVVASPWTFTTQAGVSRNGSAFGSTAYSGDAVAILQSSGGTNGSVSQNLAVPTGSYQVNFQAIQRNYTSLDQRLNVFLNDGLNNVFIGAIQPNNIPTYEAFTSATFNVFAPALTATVSTTSASPTSTSPIPFQVNFSQSVGTSFTASDVTVTGGTVTSGSFSGSGAGPYTFTVTPSGFGTVTVSLASGVATDANNTQNSASNSVSVQFQAPTITVAPASLPGGTRGAAYSQTLTASGGTAPYTYAVTAGALPSGLTLSSAGVLSGTPAASGSFTFTVTATDASTAPGPYTGSRSYTLTIAAPAVTLAPATLPNGTVATAYSQTLTASGGTAPYTYAVTAGALPSGLTLSSAGVLSGTPTAGGSFTFTVTATDASTSGSGGPYTGSQSYTLTVAAPTIVVAPASLPGGTRGAAYSQTLTASGGTAPYTYAITAGALPSGLTLTSAGVLSGTPAASGSFTFTVTATDASTGSGPYTGSRSYTLSIAAPAITLAPATLPSGTVAAAYSQTLTASGGTAPYTYAITAGALPAGLTLSSAGVLSGTPTAGGSFTFTVTATDASTSGSGGPYTGSQSYTLTVAAPSIAVAPAALPGGTVGAAYSQTLSASGGTAPYTYAVTAGSLPSGLTLTSAGVLSGTPAASGPFTFTVTATDASTGSGPYTGSRSYTLSIAAPTIALAPATLPNGQQGVAYSQTLTASGGTAPYTYAVTAGFLPSGLSLTNGTIAGTPATNGTFNFTVTATDAFGSTGSQAYSLVIAAPAVTAVTWTGTVSTDWFTAGNWSPNQVPTATLDATIPTAPSGGRFPAISAGTANVRNLTLNSGASLTQSNGTVNIAANLTNNGTYQPTGGTVVLGNTTLSNILGSSNTRFWNLTIGANGAQLATSAGASLQRLFTLNGNFATNSNPFTLVSDANGTALVVNSGGVVNGTATVQRYIAPDLNAGLGYRHYTAPVSGATVASLATGSFSPVVNPAYNTSATPTAVPTFPTVYGYDQARLATTTNNLAAFDKGWFSPNSTGDALALGQGYTVNLAANQTFNVSGTPNNGTIALNLARNSGATATDAGWALVGNPYPSPLDYSLVGAADRANLDAAIYVFESTSQYAGSYRANVNGVGGNANSPNSVLAQGQGFFVRVSNGQTAGTLTFRNSQRLTSYTNPVYHRTAETRPLVQLDLTSATGTDPVYVYFENGATTGVDREMDAVKLPNSNGLNVSAETGAQRLAINALPTLGTATVTVPLTVGVPAVGSFSFNASQLLNLGTTPVYLRDKQSGAVVDLRTQPSYQFTVSNASALITGRFELVFSPQAALATAPAALAAQVGVYPNPATTTAYVELPAVLGRVAVAAELVDALGRTVRTQSLPAQGAAAHRLDLADLATGVYTLHLATSAGVVVKKLVVQ